MPPIRFSFNKIYTNYVVQFNFLYETNSALRPKNQLKGKKLYIFYSDGFRIWHDYSMNYLGIEDKYGNSYKNLIPNFNTENENLFTITVSETDGVYKGKVFVNGVKIHMPSFTGWSLSYILFCHNDTACPAGSDVFWTSGFYNMIKLYDINDITIYNDNSFYDLFIYNNYYSNYYYQNNDQRYNDFPYTEAIFDMTINGIDYNHISGYTITNFYTNDDNLQMFNYGIDQTLSLRNWNANYNNIHYIDENFIQSNTCPNSLSCYGGGNIFTEEARACSNTEYFKYDICESFPSTKNKYYTLSLPLKENAGITLLNYNLNNLDKTNSIKVTYTFWIKLIRFKNANNIIRIGDSSNNCILSYNTFEELLLQCGGGTYYESTYTISRENYGKYMHISIALSMHSYNGAKKNFISFQIDNSEIIPQTDNLGSASIIDITQFTLYTEIYAQISKFYIYNEVLIGGYAFNTNKHFQSSPQIIYKIVDESIEDCLSGSPVTAPTGFDSAKYGCIQDYDPAFNNDYYIDPLYYSQLNVFLTQNNMYKIKSCNENCATSCYETGETQCACATNGYYDYIFYDSDNKSYQCRKFPYFDFKRYKSWDLTLTGSEDIEGFDFWFYATQGVNNYGTSTELFKISVGYTIITININGVSPSCALTCIDGSDIIQNWCHASCPYSSSISTIKFENSESALTSPGIMLIRQFKLWKGTYLGNTAEIYNTAFIDDFERDDIKGFLILSVDSLINSDKTMTSKANQITGISSFTPTALSNEIYFGYSPIDKEIPELELCLENEECKDIINLSGINDLTFEKITPSGVGRYTMELWMKIKNVKDFLNGINMVWFGHLSISVLTDASENQLSLYLFDFSL